MPKNKFQIIQKKFKKITGFYLELRRTNFLEDKRGREDNLLERLSRLYFDCPRKILQLKKDIKKWLLLEEKSETLLALAGTLAYLTEDFKSAKNFFLKAISLNPDNFDNWRDLAFALRHLGKEEESNGIFFNFDYVIYYYKYLGLEGADYKKLKRMILRIQEKANG